MISVVISLNLKIDSFRQLLFLNYRHFVVDMQAASMASANTAVNCQSNETCGEFVPPSCGYSSFQHLSKSVWCLCFSLFQSESRIEQLTIFVKINTTHDFLRYSPKGVCKSVLQFSICFTPLLDVFEITCAQKFSFSVSAESSDYTENKFKIYQV